VDFHKARTPPWGKRFSGPRRPQPLHEPRNREIVETPSIDRHLRVIIAENHEANLPHHELVADHRNNADLTRPLSAGPGGFALSWLSAPISWRRLGAAVVPRRSPERLGLRPWGIRKARQYQRDGEGPNHQNSGMKGIARIYGDCCGI